MTVTYGFYNSIASDRLYDAVQLSKFMEGVVIDGVMSNIGNKLNTVQNSGMGIFVGSGKAWFNNTWTYNDANISLTVTASHPTLNRIDSVVLEVDTSTGVRANVIKMIDGTAGSSPVQPTLTDTSTKFYKRLANIYVGTAVTQILTANITIKVGTVDCPYCISGMWETTNLQNQIDALTATLNGLYYKRRVVEIGVLDNNTTLTVKDGVGDFAFTIPLELNSYKLIMSHVRVSTASTSGLPTFQIWDVGNAQDILSTKISVDANEYSSYTAAAPPVPDGTKNTVATAGGLRLDCDIAGTGTKGLNWILVFEKA